MKNFLTRILLAAAMTLVAFALASSAQSQPSDEDPAAPAAPRPSQTATPPHSAQTGEAPLSSSSDIQTQEALAFTGRVVKQHSLFVLSDPVTKMSYRLNDQVKVRRYLGKQVKVVGKLEMNSNTIHIDSIEPLS